MCWHYWEVTPEMLGKLSIRNAKRQAKEYSIYFITMMIAVGLMFSFNSIIFSEDVKELATTMENFSTGIIGVSIVVVFVIAWLINYTMKFMIEKRSNEFGMYSILGIEKNAISNMFVFENSCIGIFALLLGMVLGSFIYQIFIAIIMNIFEQPYQIEILFSIKAVLLTALYFVLIFVFALLRNRRKIKKTKVYALLYSSKQNENTILKKAKGNIVVFVLSIIIGVIGLIMLYNTYQNGAMIDAQSLNKTVIAVILILICIYLFYISIVAFIGLFIKNKKIKYRKNTMFLLRTITSKINTMSITMATLAMLFTFSIVGINLGMLLKGTMENEIDETYPFEILMESRTEDFSKQMEYIEKNAQIQDSHCYVLYQLDGNNLYEILSNTPFRGKKYDYDNVMKLSDYNKLRKMMGLNEVKVAEDEYILHCMDTALEYFKEYSKQNTTLKVQEKTSKLKEIKSEHFSLSGYNGDIFFIVLPDKIAELLPKAKVEQSEGNGGLINPLGYKMVVKTKETTNQEFYKGLRKTVESKTVPVHNEMFGKTSQTMMEFATTNINTRGERESQTKSMYTIFSFLAFYFSLVFVMASATILAMQQLSDSAKYKYRYKMLAKLGMDFSQINKLVLKQLLIHFLLPLVLPIILGTSAVIFVSNIFTIMVTKTEIMINLGMTYGIFFIIYFLYLLATYVQFKRNINSNT